MSAPIGPGDWVERVDAGGEAPVGTVRRVQAIRPMLGHCRHCNKVNFGLVFSGFDYLAPAYGHCPEHWRPIYKPSESLFLERLMDVPASPELEPA